MIPDSYKSPQARPLHFSAVKVCPDRSLIAAAPGKGIYRKTETGEWSRLSDGLPAGAAVNRLQLTDGTPYACTSRGLYRLCGDKWQFAEVSLPCYQYKEEWGFAFAATQSGLYYRSGDAWKESAFANSVVYDFLFSPQFLYVGLEQGISMYDRLTDKWAAFSLGFAVTSLAAAREALYGATDRGELVISDGKGGFNAIGFPDIFIFSVVHDRGSVFVCSDRGLFRIGRLGGHVTLFSVRPGVPVTDIDWHGSELFMATLSKGIQSIRTECLY
jgi:hypothetical protein